MEAGRQRWLTDRRAAMMSQQGDDGAGDEMAGEERRGEERREEARGGDDKKKEK